jgi:hypothetical protein
MDAFASSALSPVTSVTSLLAASNFQKNWSPGSGAGLVGFASYSAGLNATSSLLQTNAYQSLSIDGAISRYAPSFENNTAEYQNFISNSVGVPGSTSMSALTDSQFSAVVGGIVSHEGHSRGQVITVIGAPD